MATKKPAAKPAEEKKSTAVVKTGDKGAVALPDFMKAHAGKGTEDIKQSDIEMPRLKLLQGISEELQTFDGLKAGEFFHTLLEQSLGEQLVVVPVYKSTRYVLWRPRPPIDQGGILARADDGIHWQPANAAFTVKIDRKGTTTTWKTAETVAKSGLDQWGTFDPTDPNSQPAATKCHVIVVALPDHLHVGPVALLLQRSAIKPAQKWLGKLKLSQAPIYGQRFLMSSFIENGEAGDYNAYRFQADGFVEDADEFKMYAQFYENFKQTGVQVKDLENAQDEDAASGSRGNAAAEEKY